MDYLLLGKSGLRISELCLGTMTFGEDWGWGANKDESHKMFDAFAAAGGNFIDTADGYTNGTSEKLVGEFVKAERERFVIATKYSFNSRPGDPNAGGNHRKHMVEALNGSLRRLGTDYVDLYWVHAWDELTPVEEVMRALDDVVRAGKVLYLGISDAPAWWIARANTLAELRGWTPFIGLQVEYNLVERTVERELLPMARALGLGMTAWSPLASGLLTGKYSKSGGEQRRLQQAPSFEQLSLDGKNERALTGASRTQLATRPGRCHSDSGRTKDFSIRRQSKLPGLAARPAATGAAGRGKPH